MIGIGAAVIGCWIWLQMLASYMTTTGLIETKDYLTALIPGFLIVVTTLWIHRSKEKEVKSKNQIIKIFTCIWIGLPLGIYTMAIIDQRI